MSKPYDLDGGLSEAFRHRPEGSALTAIRRRHGATGSVLLKEVATESAPIRIRPEGGGLDSDSRFRVLGEIARGGMGIVYQGHDLDLNRDVALKVLRAEYCDKPEVVQRFIEEAQVGGQLQHPGIAPIYALTMQDGQLCFAMKLIKGQTLASLLEARPKDVDLKAVFEQVAQTMAYAHSRGVIHRDLKPANVMVGAFGEVQVVDWGFAKVLGREEQRDTAPLQTMIATVRSLDDGSNSIAGSVMGTPGYMPPEQALGQIDELDERADVFALGAILCEILTGEPPYTGDAGDQLIAAAQCRLDEAFARLDACDAAPGLVKLVRACLQPKRADRPKDAGVVASQLADHFSRVAERAHEARIGVAKARAEARSAARGRRRVYALAGLVLVAVSTGAAGWAWIQDQAKARADQADREVAATLREATGHEGRENWPAAVASAQQAVQKAADEGVDGRRAATLLARLQQAAAAAAAQAVIEAEDDALLAELDAIRGRLMPEYAGEELPGAGPTERLPRAMRDALVLRLAADSDAAYAAAFARRFDTLTGGAPRLAASHQVAGFAANLTHWARLRKNVLRAAAWQELDQLARQLDPSHDDAHAILMADDREALLTLARDRAEDLTPALACQVALALLHHDRPQAAADLLTRQLLATASDFWLNHRMAEVSQHLGDRERQVRFETAALSLQPGHRWAWREMAQALSLVGDPIHARIAADRALAFDPDDAHCLVHLGDALRRTGDADAAVAAYRRAVALAPGDARSHNQLGLGPRASGDHADAVQAFQDATMLEPTDSRAQRSLGRALLDRGDADGAMAAYLRARELQPDDVESEAAIEALEQELRVERVLAGEAIEATPSQRAGLAEKLRSRGRYELALAMYRRAFDEDATLASDLEGGHRYAAACCAARTGGEANLARALTWLRADLRLRGAQLRRFANQKTTQMALRTGDDAAVPPDADTVVKQRLGDWQQDPDLAAIRDVPDLPPQFTLFWSDVAALIAEAPK